MRQMLNLVIPTNLRNYFQTEKYLSIHPLLGINVIRNH